MLIQSPSAVREQAFQRTGQKRGYNEELSQQYAQDRMKVAQKSDKAVGAIALGTVAATAGKIALDAKKMGFSPLATETPESKAVIAKVKTAAKNLSARAKEYGKNFFEASKEQLLPLAKQDKISAAKMEAVTGKNKIGFLGKTIVEATKCAFRSMKGMYQSIPKAVRIPATIAVAAVTLRAIAESNKVEAKYDTLQHIENNK